MLAHRTIYWLVTYPVDSVIHHLNKLACWTVLSTFQMTQARFNTAGLTCGCGHCFVSFGKMLYFSQCASFQQILANHTCRVFTVQRISSHREQIYITETGGVRVPATTEYKLSMFKQNRNKVRSWLTKSVNLLGLQEEGLKDTQWIDQFLKDIQYLPCIREAFLHVLNRDQNVRHLNESFFPLLNVILSFVIWIAVTAPKQFCVPVKRNTIHNNQHSVSCEVQRAFWGESEAKLSLNWRQSGPGCSKPS